MARKRKEPRKVENIEILDVAAEGKSLAKIDEMVLFLPYGAPGDIVDAVITKKKHRYAEGYIDRIVRPSELRVAARCPHFTVCGGCKWQHLPYEYQLKAKQKQVSDALQRIAKVELPEISPIKGSAEIWGYRNKLEYTFSNRKWLTFDEMREGKDQTEDRNGVGFHIPGAFDKVLDISTCLLQEDFSDRLRLFVKSYALDNGLTFYDQRAQKGFLRTLVVRTSSTGEKMAVMVFGEDDSRAVASLMEAIKVEFPEITSLHYVINLKVNDSIADQEVTLFSGKPYIEEVMEELRFRISPKSFYQTNSRQAYELYKVARDFAALRGDELVYDLYTGTGTIANFIARRCRHVIGIEYVEDAIVDAKINAEVNGLDNTEFYAGDMKDVLSDEFIAEHGRPEVMVIDPPRAGMHQDVVDVILRARPQRIVYVSCNPATQARDLALLDCEYKVTAVQPVDMFPHTHHVENVVGLELRGGE